MSILDALKLVHNNMDVPNVLLTLHEVDSVITTFAICESNPEPHCKSYFGIKKYCLEYEQQHHYSNNLKLVIDNIQWIVLIVLDILRINNGGILMRIFLSRNKKEKETFMTKPSNLFARTAIMSNSDESNIIKKSFQKTFINSLFELEAKNIASEKRGNKCLGKDDVRDKEPLTLSNVSTENCVAVC